MGANQVKPLTWGHINIGHTPPLTLLCCAHLKLQPRQWRTPNVHVPYWRLYWNDRPGAFLLAEDGHRHPLEPGRFSLVAPNTTLSQELAQPVEHYYTHFTVGMPFAHIQNHVYQFPAPPLLLEAMHGAYPRQGADADLDRQTRLAATALNLCWHALATLPETWLPPEDCLPPRLQELLKWWEGLGWRPTPSRALAARLGMHPSAFCRHFQHAMGAPPQTYGQMRRIDRACLLLHFSTLSIKQIAEDTGFCDRYYFSYRFRKLRGISPAAFRRQFIAGAPGPENHA